MPVLDYNVLQAWEARMSRYNIMYNIPDKYAVGQI